MIYLFNFIPRLFGMVVFSGYDSKCAIYERASFFNCTQDFPVTQPKQWMLYSLVMSILSSISLYFICDAGKQMNIRKTCCKASFVIMFPPFIITAASFLVRIVNTKAEDMPLCLALFMWWPSTACQLMYLDNLSLGLVTNPRNLLP